MDESFVLFRETEMEKVGDQTLDRTRGQRGTVRGKEH
jgi:hypothetical protein